MYKIPLKPFPNQKFKITIPVDGDNLTLNLSLSYNSVGNYWMLSILDKQNNVLISNINVFTTFGEVQSNLLYMYSYLNLGSIRVVPLKKNNVSMPNDKNLGVDFILVWGDTE